ncbi:exonuclease domain-containing protein [Gardnerella vaginalis]|uniref:3'-5' exonuclease n=1 Tax=Gardnerella vaginalis TaxID=2702 RepID=UPI0039EF5001
MKLSGKYSFYADSRFVVDSIDISRSHSFKNCIVTTECKDEEEHVIVKNSYGNIIFETKNVLTEANNVLMPLVGHKLEYFSYKPKTSSNSSSNLLQFSLKVEMNTVSIPCEDIIPRIVLDTETTGLDPEADEILQLAIIDGNGNVLWNKLYKPEYVTYWPKAEAINHINPFDVRKCECITKDVEAIQNIINRAREICAFNAKFDLAFLAEIGIRLNRNKVTDTMREYAETFYGSKTISLKWAAKECKYSYNAHDALEDCKATLHVQNKVDKKRKRNVLINKKIDSEKCLTGYMPSKIHRLHPNDNKKFDEANSPSYIHFMLTFLLIVLCLFFLFNSCNDYHNKDYYSDAIPITSNVYTAS